MATSTSSHEPSGVVGRQGSRQASEGLIPEEIRIQSEQCSDSVYTASIWFTDAAGNWWERDARGALKPLS